MKRVYLSETLPANAKIEAGNGAADIRQKMQGYRAESKQYRNEAPHIRPFPMQKYETHKIKRIEKLDDDDDNGGAAAAAVEAGGTKRVKRQIVQALEKLPGSVQRKARRLAPHIALLDLGEEELGDVLYDLTSPAKRLRVQNIEILRSVLRQLSENNLVDPRWYVNKMSGGYGATTIDKPRRQYKPRRNTVTATTKRKPPKATAAPPATESRRYKRPRPDDEFWG